MTNKIKEVLNSIGIKSFFITKEAFNGECVVYNYTSKSLYYADNIEKAREYTILLNVYSVNDIEKTKEKIRKAMFEHGFKGGVMQKTLKENTGLFNTPILFKGYL